MKKLFFLALAAANFAILTGCSNFLDVKTEGALMSDTYFANDQQAIDAVDYLFADFDDEDMYSQNLHWDMCTGNMLVAAREGDASSWFGNFKLEYSGDAARMPAMFEMIYKNIARANWVVNSLVNKEKGGTELTYVENRSLGEAYFYRAFWHYLIAYRYGCETLGVPFVAYETYAETHEGAEYNYDIPEQQKTVMDNYQLIINDFESAYSRLPKLSEYSASEVGRPQKEACLAMEARIYAYWAAFDDSMWSAVINTVNNLEQMGRKLAPTYDVLFTDQVSEYFSDEYCWGLPGYGDGTAEGGTWFEEVCIPSQIAPQIDGWGEFNTSYDMYVEYEKDGVGNDRMKRSLTPVGSTIKLFGDYVTIEPYYGDQSQSGYMIYKWCRAIEEDKSYSSRINMMFHIMRFADCLLLRAEANLAKGNPSQAAVDINTVRQRSNLKLISGNATWADIYHERRCELAFEGMDYMYDLKRWALSGAPEIKELAIKELEGHAQAGIYLKDGNGEYVFDHAEDYALYRSSSKKWEDFKICFPYPTNEIVKSNGALKQNPGY